MSSSDLQEHQAGMWCIDIHDASLPPQDPSFVRAGNGMHFSDCRFPSTRMVPGTQSGQLNEKFIGGM
ncbi:hypothetical protein STEG23_019963 [Scotinomys teguina]